MNCVEAGLDFREASESILIFSCPRDGVMGYFSAVAIDWEMMPAVSSSGV